MIDKCVEVGSQAFEIDLGRGRERRHGNVRRDEAVALHRSQLTHRYAVAGDDERLSPVESPHDLAAVISELSLGDFAHSGSVALVLQKSYPRPSLLSQ